MFGVNVNSKSFPVVISKSRYSIPRCIAALMNPLMSLTTCSLHDLRRSDFIGSVTSRDSMTEYTTWRKRMLVVADNLVGRKERMRHSIESGRMLILSSVGIDRWGCEVEEDIAVAKLL
ncbi:hypothetical protein L195_g053921 [Trifolium pratense]|uniref:Uncharacterized protein n=1 Tax=Trifolium pratense TaxID=57577 RepID=A0A2K3KD94_TRIPR|nr:hypothetical protein L195_g053921 [Trifolium pratense]